MNSKTKITIIALCFVLLAALQLLVLIDIAASLDLRFVTRFVFRGLIMLSAALALIFHKRLQLKKIYWQIMKGILIYFVVIYSLGLLLVSFAGTPFHFETTIIQTGLALVFAITAMKYLSDRDVKDILIRKKEPGTFSSSNPST